jgi:beta-lactamase class A
MRYAAILLLAALAGCGDPGTTVPAADKVRKQTPPVVSVETRGPVGLAKEVGRLARSIDGSVAISVRDLDEGWDVQSGTTRPMPQQSVSKLWVALTVYDLMDQGRIRTTDTVMLTPSDVTLFHQPIGSLIGRNGYVTNVGDLLERALTRSDNTANDRLLRLVGGPESVRETLRRKRLDGIGFGPGERALQSGTAGLVWRQSYAWGGFERARSALPAWRRATAYREYVNDPPDGATASGITDALDRLRRADLLTIRSSAMMLATMARSTTGRARLRAGLPPGWSMAHKTGTGQVYAGRTAGFNDVGILVAPGGHAYAVAVMIGDTSAPERRRQQLISAVARAVVAAHLARHPVSPWR